MKTDGKNENEKPQKDNDASISEHFAKLRKIKEHELASQIFRL